MTEYKPDYTVPLGAFILEEKHARGWSHADLAKRSGINGRDLMCLTCGTQLCTKVEAEKLAKAFEGTSPEFWSNLAKQSGQWADVK